MLSSPNPLSSFPLSLSSAFSSPLTLTIAEERTSHRGRTTTRKTRERERKEASLAWRPADVQFHRSDLLLLSVTPLRMKTSLVYCLLLFLLDGISSPVEATIARSSIFYIQPSASSMCKNNTKAVHWFDSLWCDWITLHTDLHLDPSPRDVRVQRVNETTIQVFWSAIYYPPVERYIIHYNDKAESKPENQWSLYSPINSGATSALISGLKPSAMYNVRVSAEFSSTNIYDPTYTSSTTRREGDLSEIHVADIYRRKFTRCSLELSEENFTVSCWVGN